MGEAYYDGTLRHIRLTNNRDDAIFFF